MFKADVKEIVAMINRGETFEATTTGGAFKVKVDKYVPYCCTSIHDGNRIRASLKPKMALNDYERWYEEDPHTADFIVSMPVTIVANDSRFEYDLNRNSETCIYEEAWGKKVWKRELTSKERAVSLQKHADYYTILHALVSKIEELFGGCLVFDIHSYNYMRWEREVPLFNIGTENVDMKKYGAVVENWQKQLNAVQLTDVVTVAAINDVFFGRGYNLEYVHTHFKHSLVLATEVKKVFCNEATGDAFPKVIRSLQLQLKKAILSTAEEFARGLTKWTHLNRGKLLSKTIDENLLNVDKALYKLVQNFELLAAIVPKNTNSEKRKFFKSKYTIAPKFIYYPTKINVTRLKMDLLNLPVHSIQDVSVRNMYEAVVAGYFDKLDLVATLGSQKFLYNSLRYFGQPSQRDLQNAAYLLLLPDIPGEAKKEPLIGATEAMEMFRKVIDEYGIQAKVTTSNQIVSRILVLNSKKTILFHPDVMLRKKELVALAEHEIGVHMITTMNANSQKLNIFNVGLPVNTLTQEGLAVLSEFLSGNITIQRLKQLALRVVAVDMMCSGADYIEVFNEMRQKYRLEETVAYDLVTRVFRGGGFTKDYLYLNGFVRILRFWEKHHDLTPLLVGKTSIDFYHTINEMLQREMISQPKFITRSFQNEQSQKNNAIYNYILSGLK
ncbi:MAG: flavohemoglobin expression-modulating QEGLA motif protein [Salinivirgaceae bacterium]|jgi:uncharacterized protein (TIGR02421 family)|nr:flavohemoglobin expression-modulating QEGLA motif protein [Salinivirgaceae bacterium]